ncbi:MAG: hypothetical protein PHY35_01805 [Candidatus Omnitrophica bacterium]|nr:hypothetical protein [Candidatus Omnitrophota bacterium]
MKFKKGQTILEICLLIAFAAGAVAAMLVYIARSFQGNIRDKADQISEWQYAPGHTTVDNWQRKYSSSQTSQVTETPIQYGNLNEVNTALVNKLKEIDIKKKEIEVLKELWETTCVSESQVGAAAVRKGDFGWQMPADGLTKVSSDREKAYDELSKLYKEAEDIEKAWPKRKGNITGETSTRSEDSGWSSDNKRIYEEVDSYR